MPADVDRARAFRDSDIPLREYVDSQIAATVAARKADVADLAKLVDEKLAGMKALLSADMGTLRATIDERDKLYNERATTGKTAVDAALKSAESAVNSAFAASEKAIVKSDINSEKWRENANEWRAAMMDRESRFAPRSEMETEIKSLRQEIASLKESRSESVGREKFTEPRDQQSQTEMYRVQAVLAGQAGQRAMIGWIVAGVMVLASVAMVALSFMSWRTP